MGVLIFAYLFLLSLLDLITTKGGTNIAGMVEAIRRTDEGAALLKRVGMDGQEG